MPKLCSTNNMFVNEQVRLNLLKIYKVAIDVLKTKDPSDLYQLKKLSNNAIHDASIFQDEDSLSVAVIMYSIYKILERGDSNISVYTKISKFLSELENWIKESNCEMYKKVSVQLLRYILHRDVSLSKYIQEVIDKAKLKESSNLFRHGLSIGKAGELLGLTQWELMKYVGQTNTIDTEKIDINIKSKLNFTRGLFR